MLLIKILLLTASAGLFIAAAAILFIDVYAAQRIRRAGPDPSGRMPSLRSVRWQLAAKLVAYAWLPLLPGLGITIVPSGNGAVRVSQVSGTLPGINTKTPAGQAADSLPCQRESAPLCYRFHGPRQ